MHANGCTCKKSHCLKKYCECYEAYAFCGTNCKCTSCENYEGSVKLEYSHQHRDKKHGHAIGSSAMSHGQGALVVGGSEQQKILQMNLNSSIDSTASNNTTTVFDMSVPSSSGTAALYPGKKERGVLSSQTTIGQHVPFKYPVRSGDDAVDLNSTMPLSLKKARRTDMYVDGEEILKRRVPIVIPVSVFEKSAVAQLNTGSDKLRSNKLRTNDPVSIGNNLTVRVNAASASGDMLVNYPELFSKPYKKSCSPTADTECSPGEFSKLTLHQSISPILHVNTTKDKDTASISTLRHGARSGGNSANDSRDADITDTAMMDTSTTTTIATASTCANVGGHAGCDEADITVDTSMNRGMLQLGDHDNGDAIEDKDGTDEDLCTNDTADRMIISTYLHPTQTGGELLDETTKTKCYVTFTEQPIIVYPFFGSCGGGGCGNCSDSVPDSYNGNATINTSSKYGEIITNRSPKMPKMLVLYIIDFLSDGDICRLSLVNKLWHSVAMDDALWE